MDRTQTADFAITMKRPFNHRISHTCGLGDIVRQIERGTTIKLAPKNAYDKNLAADILPDRMTQPFDCKASDLKLMFAQGIPTPATVPMHARGSNPREVLRHANRTLGLALGEPEMELLVEAYSMDGQLQGILRNQSFSCGEFSDTALPVLSNKLRDLSFDFDFSHALHIWFFPK